MPPQIDAALTAIQKRATATIAILVNNAGITRDNLLVRMKDEEWDDIMATNLKSVFRLSKAVLRGMMKARYGRIINITLGRRRHRAIAGQTNYAAAKAGVVGFSKVARARSRQPQHHGQLRRARFHRYRHDARARRRAAQGAARQIPLGRLGTSTMSRSAVLFLARPRAAYITGCTLHVNGGMHMD